MALQRIFSLLILLFPFFMFSSCSPEPVLRSGRVLMTSGVVRVELNGEVRTLQAGEQVWAGALLSTGASSVCDIQIGESVLRLRPNAAVVLRDLQRAVRIDLSRGAVIVRLGSLEPEKDRFRVTVRDVTVDFLDRGGLVHAGKAEIVAAVRDGAAALERAVLTNNRQASFVSGRPLKIATLSGLWEFEMRALESLRPLGSRRDDQKTGLVSLDSRPSGAELFVDGFFSSRAPLRLVLSADENHDIRAEMPGFEPAERMVRLAPGEHQEIILPLKADVTNYRVFSLWTGEAGRHIPVRADTGAVFAAMDSRIRRAGPVNRVFWSVASPGPVLDGLTADAGSVFYYAPAEEEITALSVSDGRILWQKKTGVLKAGPAAAEGKVFFGTASSLAVSLDAKTGEELWQTGLSAGITGRPALHDGKVLYRTADGALHALDSTKGTRLWKADLPGRPGASSVLTAGGRVYCVNLQGDLFCFDAGGKQVFVRKTGVRLSYGLVHDRGRLFAGTPRGEILCLDAARGTVLWKKETGRLLTAAPAVSDGRLFLGFASGTIHIADPETGDISVIRRVAGRVNALVPSGSGVIAVSDSGVFLIVR